MALAGLSVIGVGLSPEGDLRRGAEEASHKILPTRTRSGQKRKCLARLVILVKISNYSSINLDVYGSTYMIRRYCGGYEDLSSHAVRLLSVQSRGNPGQLSIKPSVYESPTLITFIYLCRMNIRERAGRPITTFCTTKTISPLTVCKCSSTTSATRKLSFSLHRSTGLRFFFVFSVPSALSLDH